MTPVEVCQGDSAIVLGLPHTGTHVPADILARLNPTGQSLEDTDWHIQDLYDGLLAGVTTVRATFHRYVIDANRDPTGVSLYPGQYTTSLCPLTNFDGQPLYRDGQDPDTAEIANRLADFHAPYHAALGQELDRVKKLHGVVILYDCHSIRANISFLFDGTLPDFNIGTDNGATCAASIQGTVVNLCNGFENRTSILNGRFKGGWTTRHYGRPELGQHSIQMELAQSTYMQQSPPWSIETARADRLREQLRTILETLNNLALSGALTR